MKILDIAKCSLLFFFLKYIQYTSEKQPAIKNYQAKKKYVSIHPPLQRSPYPSISVKCNPKIKQKR